MNNNQELISLVCPFYNEEKMVSIFLDEVLNVMNDINRPFEIVCINDGSSDLTLERLLFEKDKKEHIRVINLSRNFGKESALSAGLACAKGAAVIPIDVDLQDPPELIKRFIDYWEKGYDVVLARRTDRSSDSITKKTTANIFYKLHNIVSDLKVPENVGDYRLISRRVLKALQLLPENQRFMKGLFAWVGFKTKIIDYKRCSRKVGKTNFSTWKLWNLAISGVTNFSSVPLRIWLYLGFILSFFSFFYGSFIIIKTIILGIDVPGYASLLTAILFLGGLQLLSIGILGEYIGRIYMESKQRPSYIIEKEY